MIQLLLVALATASISMTITQSSLFKGFRNWLDWKLFRCPYCIANWVAIILVNCTLISNMYSGVYFYQLIIQSFAVVTLSVIPMLVINLFMNKIDVHFLIDSK